MRIWASEHSREFVTAREGLPAPGKEPAPFRGRLDTSARITIDGPANTDIRARASKNTCSQRICANKALQSDLSMRHASGQLAGRLRKAYLEPHVQKTPKTIDRK